MPATPPDPPVSSRRALLMAALGSVMAPGSAAQQADGGDAHYRRVLMAYRRTLPAAEWEGLEEIDPAPILYRDLSAPAEHHLTRLMASLPDSAHRTLQAEGGYLKWEPEALPGPQLKLVEAAAHQAETRGLGTFPLKKGSGVSLGFAQVLLPDFADPCYAWFIARKSVTAPYWITLVRASGAALESSQSAHRERIEQILKKAASPPIPAREWLPIPPPVRSPALPPPSDGKAAPVQDGLKLIFEAYRGSLKGKELEALLEEDPLVGRRLKMSDPADLGLNRFVGRLGSKDLETLARQGTISWLAQQLLRDQRKELAPLMKRMERDALQSGGVVRLELDLASAVSVGLTRVPVEGATGPVLSFWVRAPGLLGAVWVTVSGGKVLGTPAYYDSHLTLFGR